MRCMGTDVMATKRVHLRLLPKMFVPGRGVD